MPAVTPRTCFLSAGQVHCFYCNSTTDNSPLCKVAYTATCLTTLVAFFCMRVSMQQPCVSTAGLFGGAEGSADHWHHWSRQKCDHLWSPQQVERGRSCGAPHHQLQRTDQSCGCSGSLAPLPFGAGVAAELVPSATATTTKYTTLCISCLRIAVAMYPHTMHPDVC